MLPNIYIKCNLIDFNGYNVLKVVHISNHLCLHNLNTLITMLFQIQKEEQYYHLDNLLHIQYHQLELYKYQMIKYNHNKHNNIYNNHKKYMKYIIMKDHYK